jgi:hypothetical protein
VTTASERFRRPRAFNLESPGSSEDGPDYNTPVALVVASIRVVLGGTASPSVTWTLRFAADRSAAGTEIITGGTTTTSLSGVEITSFDNPNIPADSWIWLETTAQSGTVDRIAVVLVPA